MDDFLRPMPETTVRNDLLRDCLAWIGAHYDGGDMPTAWFGAVRDTLGLPHEGLITPEMFAPRVYNRVLLGFEEILALGLHFRVDEDVTGEGRAAVATWHLFTGLVGNADLTGDQRRFAHIDAMVAGLEYWVTYTPGGLAEATRGLQRLIDAAGTDVVEDLLKP
jgi:hypothetical protein